VLGTPLGWPGATSTRRRDPFGAPGWLGLVPAGYQRIQALTLLGQAVQARLMGPPPMPLDTSPPEASQTSARGLVLRLGSSRLHPRSLRCARTSLAIERQEPLASSFEG
jgi:hypothetical protein